MVGYAIDSSCVPVTTFWPAYRLSMVRSSRGLAGSCSWYHCIGDPAFEHNPVPWGSHARLPTTCY